MLGGLSVGGSARLGVMLDEHLGTVAQTLRNHAEVEAGVEELA